MQLVFYLSELQRCSSVDCSALSQGLIVLQISNLYFLVCFSDKCQCSSCCEKPSTAMMTCRYKASPIVCSLKTLPPFFSDISSHWVFCFPHCDSCHSLFTSILSGWRTVPGSKQQASLPFLRRKGTFVMLGFFLSVF